MRRILPLAALAVAGCFDTSYHLVAPGDEHRELVSAEVPPASWKAATFDDRAWTRTVDTSASGGAGTVYERFVFDVGVDEGSISRLDLSLPGDPHFLAFINGEAMSGTGGSRTLAVPPGLLHSAGNVLALAITPSGAKANVDPTLSAVRGAREPGPHVTRGPYQLAPTATGAVIGWQTNVAAPSTVVVDGKPFDGGRGPRHFATVTGLDPSRAYRYHVEVGSERTEEADLVTAPRPGEPIRFAVFGDNRTDGDAHRRLVAALAAEAPDLVVNTGDMVGESDSGEWQIFFDIEYPLLINTPLVPAIGNHEADYGDGGQFASLFPMSGSRFGGRVYSLDYGDLHFAVLDSNGELGDQARWLDGDLTAAEARGARHEFVVMHWGPWCGVSKMSHGNNDDAISAVVPVARRHKVAALFSGHNHVYERGADGELRYVVSGGGGAPLDKTGRVRQTLLTRAVNSYVMVDVAGGRVHLTAKDDTGAVFDEAEWTDK
jgi:hypothetical protein